VAGRPFTTVRGKNAHVQVQQLDKPGVTEIRTWGAYEKVSVLGPREIPDSETAMISLPATASRHSRPESSRRGDEPLSNHPRKSESSGQPLRLGGRIHRRCVRGRDRATVQSCGHAEACHFQSTVECVVELHPEP
jgi:hypothetical protein